MYTRFVPPEPMRTRRKNAARVRSRCETLRTVYTSPSLGRDRATLDLDLARRHRVGLSTLDAPQSDQRGKVWGGCPQSEMNTPRRLGFNGSSWSEALRWWARSSGHETLRLPSTGLRSLTHEGINALGAGLTTQRPVQVSER